MWEDMHIFATVVEQSSLNRASQRLNLTQPALSRKIAKLEERLGVKLFNRTGKKLELTRIGRISYDYALQMRQLNRNFVQAIEQYKSGGHSITIGASLTTLQSTLPDLITLLTRLYPTVDIKAVTGKTHEIVSLVQEKRIDFGLVASAVDLPELNCVPLFDDHLSLVLPRNHALADKHPATIEDLNGLPMILFSKGSWYRVMMDDLFRQYGVQPDIKMEIDSFEAIIRLVSPCHTATLLPLSYLRPRLLEDNDLTRGDIPELQKNVRTTSLIYTAPAELSDTSRMMIEEAIRYFSQAGSGA
jgi:DNA-binding transcriptional LysR family regulator